MNESVIAEYLCYYLTNFSPFNPSSSKIVKYELLSEQICLPLHLLILIVLGVFAVNRVSGNPERSPTLPTKASGSILRLTTRSTQPILRSINTTVLA